ncbi:MAG: CinA family protein, partial [Pirellulales bacterium]
QLQDAVVRLLKRNDLVLATAEAGTGGLVAHWLTDVDDIESYYAGGVIVPSEVALVQLLHISPAVLRASGVASREVTGAMAVAARERFAADLGLAVAGWPEEERNESAGPPRGLVALSTADSLDVKERRLGGDPAIRKSLVAKMALNLVRLHLLKRAGQGD